jgi:adenylate cyclase
MMALVDRALALNPSYARGWSISGTLRNWAGQPDIAVEHLEAALRLSPRARIANSIFQMGEARFLGRRFDEAVPKLLLAIQEGPSEPGRYRWLASCYAHMGRLYEARAIIARLRAITPEVMPSVLPFSQPRGPRALAVRPELSGGRGRMSHSRGRAAILAAEAAG